jgi:uncharacterized membrane protein
MEFPYLIAILIFGALCFGLSTLKLWLIIRGWEAVLRHQKEQASVLLARLSEAHDQLTRSAEVMAELRPKS